VAHVLEQHRHVATGIGHESGIGRRLVTPKAVIACGRGQAGEVDLRPLDAGRRVRAVVAVVDRRPPRPVQHAVANHRNGRDAEVVGVDAEVAARLVGGNADQEGRCGDERGRQRRGRAAAVVEDRVRHRPDDRAAARVGESSTE